MTKYQDYFNRMVEANPEEFKKFSNVHDHYVLEPGKWEKEFNERGAKILSIIQEWEGRLCRESENGQYSKYTPALADKFRDYIRRHFPRIDYIGVTSS